MSAMHLDQTVTILLVRGESPDGVPIYAYVAVRADRLSEFMRAQQAGLFYPEDFGVIVESGHGEPPLEIKDKMSADYGFDHAGMVDVPGDISDTWLVAQFDFPEPDAPPSQSSIIDIGIAVNEQLIRYFSQHPDELRSIHPRKFEELVAELFCGFGYEVELTKKTRDGGVDIVAIRHAEVETKYLIECKCPSIRGYVSVRPVRELLGVKEDLGATKAILATTTRFSREAEQFHVRNRWDLELRDYRGVMDWIHDYLRRRRP